jgi:hypothetical protein
VKTKLSEDELAELEEIIEDQKASVAICHSSCKMLSFNVEDIIALPQLKDGKFTKVFSSTDIRAATQEVLSIQQQSALDKEVHLDCCFDGFPEENGQPQF